MTSLTVEQVIAILVEGPEGIAGATARVPAGRLHDRPAPDEWSPNEVLAHLRACADVWGGCIDTILAEDEPTIRAVNPRRWIESTDYVQQDFRKSLKAFAKQRSALLAVLRSLSPEAWSRRATITGAGKPLLRAVHDYAAWLASHERPHIKQIARAVDASAER